MSDFTAREIIEEIVSFQRVGPPYQGWDLDKVRLVILRLEIEDQQLSDPPNKGLELLREFVEAGRPKNPTGINITAINKVASKMREHLGLPSVEELNPDIAQLKDAARRSVASGEGVLADVAKRFNRNKDKGNIDA